MTDIIIKINDKDYKLKITLGFWKNLSFKQSDFNSIYDNAGRLAESIKLALFYGNKKDKDWGCIDDMNKEISDEAIDDIDYDLKDPLSKALIANMPQSLKDKIKEGQAELEAENNTKKK